MKKVCPRHEQAYPVTGRCPYCEEGLKTRGSLAPFDVETRLRSFTGLVTSHKKINCSLELHDVLAPPLGYPHDWAVMSSDPYVIFETHPSSVAPGRYYAHPKNTTREDILNAWERLR